MYVVGEWVEGDVGNLSFGDCDNKCYTMKNVLHKKVLGFVTNPAYVDPPPIVLIKETSNGKSDGNYFELKMCRDPTSSMSDLYEFRMSLFDHSEPEEFLFFCKT